MYIQQYSPTEPLGSNLREAAITALQRELWIVLQAAHQMAANHSLKWEDYDRIHEAHQHILRVLQEVTQ